MLSVLLRILAVLLEKCLSIHVDGLRRVMSVQILMG